MPPTKPLQIENTLLRTGEEQPRRDPLVQSILRWQVEPDETGFKELIPMCGVRTTDIDIQSNIKNIAISTVICYITLIT